MLNSTKLTPRIWTDTTLRPTEIGRPMNPEDKQKVSPEKTPVEGKGIDPATVANLSEPMKHSILDGLSAGRFKIKQSPENTESSQRVEGDGSSANSSQ